MSSGLHELYMVTESDKRTYHSLPRKKYPRPLIFHDGILAFRPTPLATLVMFMWVPLGFLLAIFRALVALSLPYKIGVPIVSFTGMKLRLKKPSSPFVSTSNMKEPRGTLYVCNHRTLLDPIYLSVALNKPLTAVTYSLSRVSELLAPIKTVRLIRNREEDKKMMDKMLRQGDLVICPEGTTCREPFLLRFSPLFAELSNEIVPVTMDTHVSMFYGTTVGGSKCLDPLFFLMNPLPTYEVEFLEKVIKESDDESSVCVANLVQGKIGGALGFECTGFTRKDKYLVLAGNDAVVAANNGPQRK
ncbi:glycerol-3-phosphate acyltransferase 1-like [Tasmannia lanceolata]|uniref:glycerol-3-phosphate acyltransferase 1-like n=1 Tax=Tasmannia lanceolata TaxID=3420 RepID=UPI004062953D